MFDYAQTHREMVCLQWLDELHCYVRHSLMRFESEDGDEKNREIDDDETFIETPSALERLALRRDEIGKFGVGRSYGRKVHQNENEEQMTFRWQRMVDDGVIPRFKNLKDEMLNNSYCRLSVSEWKEVCSK